MKVFAYQHGIYPRSEKVVAATRGLDRGRTDQAAVDAAYADDLARLIEVQHQARLDFYSDGMLRWQDLFRPLVDGIGPRPHELVRWFDTNTFFRAPEIESIDGAKLPTLVAATVPEPQVLTLPSPYTFSRAVHNAASRNRLMQDLAERLLRPAAQAGVAAGVRVVHLQEPWLAYYGIEDADWKPFSAAIGAVTNGLGATVILHCYFGDAGPHVGSLLELPVAGIGVDLIETDVAHLRGDWHGKSLLVGCIDGRHSLLEPVEPIVELANRIAEKVEPDNLYLSSNCELQYLPNTVAERKVQRLGEAARKAKELVAV